jgi:hypothetical protein
MNRARAQGERRGGGRTVPPSVKATLRTPGQPLAAPGRAAAQQRFGHSFENVRVHTDDRAADSVEAIGALAYTVGDHVVLGRGHYAPSTIPGQRLLLHELAHVAQQRREGGATPAVPQARSIAPSSG